tara:strand:+ start:14441 stop:14725 length:285 start_codon:yes stop_codon:yes gene_type:complete
MKTLLIVLSAAVAAGLICYTVFNSVFCFGLMGNQVVMKIDVFIAFIASLGILAAMLALAFKMALVRSDNRLVGQLESRIVELESRSPAPDRQVG